MRPEILLAGADLVDLVRLATELGPRTLSPTIIQAARAVSSLSNHPVERAEVGVVMLDGSENVADFYALFKSHPATRFVLLAPAFPPDAALAHVAQKYGGTFLSRKESGVVVAATV